MVRVNGKYGKTINPYTVHHKSITMHLTHEILLRNWAEKIKTSLKNEILSHKIIMINTSIKINPENTIIKNPVE